MKLGPYLKEAGVTKKSMLTWKDSFRGKRFRKDKNGIRDVELWHLYITIATFVYPRLRKFRLINASHPMGETEVSWDIKLHKMERAFKLILEDDWLGSVEKERKIDEGLRLFTEWFLCLRL